jgi:hypothetical protein
MRDCCIEAPFFAAPHQARLGGVTLIGMMRRFPSFFAAYADISGKVTEWLGSGSSR